MHEDGTTPERWLPVTGHPSYEVSSLGRVRSADRRVGSKLGGTRAISGRVLKQHTPNGYRQVKLGRGRWFAVHRLVLLAFVGPPAPDQTDARHLNGVRHDNRLENLAWGTSTENKADMAAHGTDPKGTRNGRAKLTDDDVVAVFALHGAGVPVKTIAERFGVARTQVRNILTRVRWAHVPVPDALLDASLAHLAPSR